MGWKTESLGDFYTRAAVEALDVPDDIVDKLSDRLEKETKRRTPRSGTETMTAGRTPGTLRESIVKIKKKEIHGVLVGGIESYDPVVEHVEYGTGLWGPKAAKYPIRPVRARALRFMVWNSSRIANVTKAGSYQPLKNARSGMKHITTDIVWHPGSPGHHMFLKGAVATEQHEYEIVERVMRSWAFKMRSTRRY